jgi:hypothetical protein
METESNFPWFSLYWLNNELQAFIIPILALRVPQQASKKRDIFDFINMVKVHSPEFFLLIPTTLISTPVSDREEEYVIVVVFAKQKIIWVFPFTEFMQYFHFFMVVHFIDHLIR